MSNLKRVLMLYGLIVIAVISIFISSGAHATIVYVDKEDVLKISPKPIKWSEPGELPGGRTQLVGAAGSEYLPESQGDSLVENEGRQLTTQCMAMFRWYRSHLSFLANNLIWRR